ncbi:MAG: cytochrome C [Hyphomicrobiales bacterium]
MSLLIKTILTFLILIVFTNLGSLRAENTAANTPTVEPTIQENSKSWRVEQTARRAAHKAYLQEHRVDYAWFTKHAFSQSDGIPFILLKLLPHITPEHWGSKANFLDVVGLFQDQRDPNYPIASGIGVSFFNREKLATDSVDYTSVTCGSCHIGRLTDDQGKTTYLDGGINSEFNIVQFKRRIFKSVQTIVDGAGGDAAKREKATPVFLNALDKVHAENPNYFYQNYQYQGRHLNADYERSQIANFKRQAPKLIDAFITKAEKDYEALEILKDQSYEALGQAFWDGTPGMADATGISTTGGYNKIEGFFSRLLAWWFIAPPTPGITDFMAVWEQDRRKVSWDKEKLNIHKGGGQWNGNIPLPIYRNLAAQLTSGLNDNDIRVSAYSTKLLSALPAPVYPFGVDTALANKGRTLFQENCSACHHDNNGTVYDNLGTEFNRAKIVTTPIRDAGAARLAGVCSPSTEIKIHGHSARPCAEFDGVSLVGREDLIMAAADQQLGYNALPLGGIWAQAPYLHNGSVPTLYHLLMPKSRPDQFVKSRLSYDKTKVGFSWQMPLSDKDQSAAAYVFDATVAEVLNNQGHDVNINVGGNTYKLDWSNDPEGAKALIEYLKTL